MNWKRELERQQCDEDSLCCHLRLRNTGASGCWKRQGKEFSHRGWKEVRAWTSLLQPTNASFQTSDLHKCQITNLCCFKPLRLCNQLQQQSETHGGISLKHSFIRLTHVPCVVAITYSEMYKQAHIWLSIFPCILIVFIIVTCVLERKRCFFVI